MPKISARGTGSPASTGGRSSKLEKRVQMYAKEDNKRDLARLPTPNSSRFLSHFVYNFAYPIGVFVPGENERNWYNAPDCPEPLGPGLRISSVTIAERSCPYQMEKKSSAKIGYYESVVGVYLLHGLADGVYHLRAAAFPVATDLHSSLLPGEKLLLGNNASPLVICNGHIAGDPDLVLHPPRLTDPPLVMGLPLL